jgi:pimeloyl-ACP methyl ester carboxylesterase
VFYNSKGADGRPVYDGVIGFSQGAVLASILVNKHPNLFKYFIAISAYQTTAPKYSSIYFCSC